MDAIEDQETKDQDSLSEDSGFDLQAKGQYEYKIRSSLDFNPSWAPGE